MSLEVWVYLGQLSHVADRLKSAKDLGKADALRMPRLLLDGCVVGVAGCNASIVSNLVGEACAMLACAPGAATCRH